MSQRQESMWIVLVFYFASLGLKSLPSNGILFKLRLCSFKDILCVLVPRGFTDLNNSELFDGFKPEFAFRYTQLDNKVS